MSQGRYFSGGIIPRETAWSLAPMIYISGDFDPEKEIISRKSARI